MVEQKCKNPKCATKGEDKITSRGICRSCYSIIARLIKQGKTSWTALEAAGRVDKATKTRQLSEKSKWFLESAITEAPKGKK